MRMKKYTIISSLLFSLLLSLASCKKNSDKFLGPEYVEASENFAIENNDFAIWRKNKNNTAIIQPIINGLATYAANSHFYKAKFNERVSWTVTVSADGNPAKRVIKGLSDELNIDNTLWDGGSSNDYFFNIDDSITIELTVAGSSIALKKRMKVTGVKGYRYTDPVTGMKYYLVDDFEGAYAETTGLSDFYVDLLDIGGGNTGNKSFTDVKVQGKYSYRMYGKDVNNNTYLGSCNTYSVNDFPLGTFTTNNPDSLFVNMYIYGTGKPNSTISIMVFENDKEFPLQTGYNYLDIQFDRWIYFAPVTWTGWQLVSIPYSSFKRPGSGSGKGDNKLTPSKLCGLALELDSYPEGGYEVEAMFDMLVITQGGPFKP